MRRIRAAVPDDGRRRPGRLRPLLNGLAPKLTILIGGLLAVSMLAQGFVSTLAHQHTLEQQARQHAEAVARTLATIAASRWGRELGREDLERLLQQIRHQHDLLYAAILDWDGSLIAGTGPGDRQGVQLADDPLSRDVRLLGLPAWRRGPKDDLHLGVPIPFFPGQQGAVRLGLPPADPGDLPSMRPGGAILIACLLIGGALAALLLVRRITQPFAD